MDIELIKKLNYFNIHANLGFQFDGIDKFEKYSIAYHNKIKDYWYNFITDIKANNKEEFDKIYRTGRGSVKVRAKYSYDKKYNCIDITQIPPTTTSEAIIDKIVELVKTNKIKEEIHIFLLLCKTIIYNLSKTPFSKSSILYIVSSTLKVSSRLCLALFQPVPSVNQINVTPATFLASSASIL